MLDVNNKGNDVEGGGREEGFPASCFYKLKNPNQKDILRIKRCRKDHALNYPKEAAGR